MSYRIFFFFLFLISLFQTSFSEDPRASFDVESYPSSFVNGSVNVITGSYSEAESTTLVPGPTPLRVSRYYSTDTESGIDNVWRYNHHNKIDYLKEIPKDKDCLPKWSRIYLNEASGAFTIYSSEDPRKAKYSNGSETFKIDIGKNLRLLTNCGSGEMSARTNVKNIHVDRDKKTFNVSYPDGSLGVYGKPPQHCYRNLPPEETYIKLSHELPTDHRIEYAYNYMTDLIKVVSKRKSDGGTQTSLSYQNSNQRHHQRIQGSNGRWIEYKKPDIGGNKLLNYVSSSEGPDISYTYENNFARKLKRKELAGWNYLETEYYTQGWSDVGLFQVDAKKSNHICIGRVKLQKEPVGTTDEAITTYKFNYQQKKVTDHSRQKGFRCEEGYTDVYDAYDNLTRYHNDKHLRLTHIEYFNGSKLDHAEKMIWGEASGQDATNLKAQILLNASNRAYHSKTFLYDKKGNVLKETTFGNLTGNGIQTFTTDKLGFPKNKKVESYATQYQYSDDKYNLLLAKIEDNGRRTEYAYHENSSFLAVEYLLDHKDCKERIFYFYDKDGSLIKKITDDGKDKSHESLKGVSNRLIEKMSISYDGASYGSPKEIIQYYLDLSRNKEVQLSRKTYAYNSMGRQSQLTYYDANDDYNYTIQYSYDQKGRISETIDSRGTVKTAQYDESGNLIFSQGPSTAFYTLYSYDFMNRLIKREENHSNGKQYVERFAYDYLGNKTFSRDIYGNFTEYTYDALSRLSSITEASSGTKHYSYNDCGKLEYELDGLAYEKHYEYNSRGEITKVIFPDKTEESYVYNLDGSLTKKITNDQSYTIYERDYKGRIISETLYSPEGIDLNFRQNIYDAKHLLQTIDPEGISTYYTYDDAGRLICKKMDYQCTEYAYDAQGNQSSIKAYSNKTDYVETRKAYDLFKRLIKKTQNDFLGEELSSIAYLYDIEGRCIERHEGLAIYQWAFNSRGELISETDAEGNTYHYLYEQIKNAKGHGVLKKTMTDPEGLISEYEYDTLGKEVSRRRQDVHGDCLDIQKVTYDLNGRKIQHEHQVFQRNHYLKTIYTLWEWGALDHLLLTTEAYGTADQKISRQNYDHNGRLQRKTLSDGIRIEYFYDAAGRLKEKESSEQSIHFVYHYDKCHRITKAENLVSGEFTLKEYDALGKVILERLENGEVLSYSYDGLGRCLDLAIADSKIVAYEYDGIHLREVSRLKQGKKIYSHRYDAYDLRSNLLLETTASKKESQYSWDLKNRPLSYQSAKHYKNWYSYQSSQYSWSVSRMDGLGHVLSMDIEDSHGSYTADYRYSSLYQLENEDSWTKHQYSYDSRENRLSKDAVDYEVNALDHLTSTGTGHFDYDLRGNRIKSSQATYRYDVLNRLVEFQQDDLHSLYHYDAFDRRIKEERLGKDPKTIHYLYHGNREIASLDEKGTFLDLRIWGRGAAIAIELNGKAYVPHHDYAGSVIALSDLKTGTELESYRFTAFGEEKTSTRPINPWRYASKRVDPSGLVYFGKRYYCPSEGRWLTKDPAGDIDGPNLYTYVHNNPIYFSDAYGLWSFRKSWDSTKRSYSSFKKSVKKFFSGKSSKIHSNKPLQSSAAVLALGGAAFLAPEAILVATAVTAGVTAGVAIHWTIPVVANLLSDKTPNINAKERESSGGSSGGGGPPGDDKDPGKEYDKNGNIVPKEGVGKSNGFLGRKGWELKNPKYQDPRNAASQIGGREYSAHALDQMQNRGVMPRVIEDAIKNGSSFSGKRPGTTAYFNQTNNISVIVDKESGRVITSGFGRIRQ